jgi:hypothetical protein
MAPDFMNLRLEMLFTICSFLSAMLPENQNHHRQQDTRGEDVRHDRFSVVFVDFSESGCRQCKNGQSIVQVIKSMWRINL